MTQAAPPQPARSDRYTFASAPGSIGPVVMTVFGVVMFAAGWLMVGFASQLSAPNNFLDDSVDLLGFYTKVAGGLLLAIVGGMLWVGGRIAARINGWQRWVHTHR